MNERIKQLLEEATDVYDDWKTGTTHSKVDYKMFAELIVRECLSQADKMRDSMDADGSEEQAMGAEWVAMAISRHFGVE